MKKLLVSTLILAAASNAFAKGIEFNLANSGLPLSNWASENGSTFFASDGRFCDIDPDDDSAGVECMQDEYNLDFNPSDLTSPDDGARFAGVYNKNNICLYFSDDECSPYTAGLIKIIDENGHFNYSIFERPDGSYAWSEEPVELEVKWSYYFCEELTKYFSCDNGYYMANRHEEYENGGGNCVACPDGAYCPGGTDAPVYTVTIDLNGLDMGACDEMEGGKCRPLEIYRSASAGTYCLNREKCTSANKDLNDTLANGGRIEDSIGSWVPSDYSLFKSFGYFADSNAISRPVLLADTSSPEVVLESAWDSISDQALKPDWPAHMKIYAIATSDVTFDPGDGRMGDDTDSKSLAMHTGVGLGSVDRTYSANRAGYTFTGWYTEDGNQVYDALGVPQLTSYDGSYHVLYAGYKLDFCPAGQYPKGEKCVECPTHNLVRAESPDQTTKIEQCYIPGGEGSGWLFTDGKGAGIKYFETECHAGGTEN